MKHLASSMPRRKRLKRRIRLGRILRGTLYVKLGLALTLGLVTGLLYVRLSAAPLSFDGLSERVADAIAARIGPDWKVVLKDSALTLEDGSFALKTSGLEIRNPDGLLVVRSPDAIVSVDSAALLRLSLQPRLIEFRDLQVRAAVNRDGTLSFVAAEGSEPQAVTRPPAGPPSGPPSKPDPAGEPSIVAHAVGSLFDLILEPRGVVGALDRARVTNARLMLTDAEGRERATFRVASGIFERSGLDSRRFDVNLDGPRGSWRISGDLKAGGRHRGGKVSIEDLPGEDLLLLSGLSNAPARANLKLSGQAEAIITEGRLAKLEMALATGAGTVVIDDKDMPPIEVGAATGRGAWDEAARKLSLNALTFRARETDIRLHGELTALPGQGWRLALSGEDAVVSGSEPGEKSFVISTVEAAAAGRDGVLALERLTLRGPALDVSLDASYGSPEDAKALRVNGSARQTAVRTALRLWPDSVVPKVRRHLVANLRGGTAESIDLAVALSGPELTAALSEQPVPDQSVKVAFAIKQGELNIAEGLPPLLGIVAKGLVTGATADVRVPQAVVQMPDGRVLGASEGSFTIPNNWAKDAKAAVALRLDGGADALGAFLQAPLLQGAVGVDLDPAAIRGQTDLRLALSLPLTDVPKIADLPLSISGSIGGLTVEKAFGKEKLDNANLTVSYANGAASIKGEGRLWGVPAAIDVRQPKAAAGEAVVSLTLDDAARARKGMTFGPQLTGPVPVKVALPLGPVAKSGARVEVDLTRAVIDNLVPGWVKPTGKPGKLSFFVPDASSELRDFVLDSGTVQMRGAVTLSTEGQLERAELSSFKLSPGDDMRAQLERAGSAYKVTVRGAVADTRPFIRSLTAPSPASGSGREAKETKEPKETKDARDIELDVATNILTGFNDEALTAASVKASIKSRELRQLQFSGKFRSAPVTAQLARFERGSPVLVLESQDAGATLRFVDIYRRMHGGSLALHVTTGDGPQRGALTVERFTLRNEPALKRIAATQVQGGAADDRGNIQMPRFETNEVEFTRLQAEFGRTASRLEFRDAVIWGMQVGFKASGWIDYGRDRTDISGTFVPAYALNNAFAQVPLFGPILGGGQNEGLFAVNFRISGPASSPTLTVNPLSVVAPGFLRKLFGTGAGAMDATGATGIPVPRPER
jgi:Protein of unknown function